MKILMMILMFSCSQQAIYESIQLSQKEKCYQMANKDEQRACLKRYEHNYQEYQDSRLNSNEQ
jgi:hypothetical protein